MPTGPASPRPLVTVVICAYADDRANALTASATAVLPQLSSGDELVVVIDHNDALLESTRAALLESTQESTRAALLESTQESTHAALLESTQESTHAELLGESGGGGQPLRVIPNHNQRGLSGARNTGVSAARGEVIAFIDDDAVPRPDWLEQLLAPFADHEVIGAGGVAAPAWETAEPGWLPREFLWVVGCSYRGLPEQPTEIRNPIGANMAFRRSVFEAVGGFTHGIGRVGRTPLGCEETELSVRATSRYGGRIVQQPSATVDHAVTADRLSLDYFVRRCWAEGISKAIVSRLAGAPAALSSERRYTTRTLPAGVARGLWDGLRGDLTGFQRATMIIGGLAVTVAGYLRGSASRLRPEEPGPGPASSTSVPFEPGSTPVRRDSTVARADAPTPVWSGQIELNAPSLPERLLDPDGHAYQRARLLVRACGTPLGFVEIDTPDGRPDLTAVTGQADEQFGKRAQDACGELGWIVAGKERISVVLCTHNRASGALQTLDSLTRLKHAELEIIVVDNAPDDDSTLQLVTAVAQADPRVRYVREPLKGLSRARNRGLAEASGELVAFTDDDVRVDALWLQGLMRGFARAPEVACVTGLVASRSLTTAAEQYFDQRVWWSSSCEQRLFRRERGPRDSALHPYAAGAFGTGANFAARTSVLRTLGGFDQALGAGSPTRGGEDLDIFVRILTSGHAISYEPSALVWHDHRVDQASLRHQMYAYGLGLTAYLTKYLLSPESRGELIPQLLRGARHASALLLRSRRAGESAALDGPGMVGPELGGMLMGPIAYLRARRLAAGNSESGAESP